MTGIGVVTRIVLVTVGWVCACSRIWLAGQRWGLLIGRQQLIDERIDTARDLTDLLWRKCCLLRCLTSSRIPLPTSATAVDRTKQIPGRIEQRNGAHRVSAGCGLIGLIDNGDIASRGIIHRNDFGATNPDGRNRRLERHGILAGFRNLATDEAGRTIHQ